MLGPSVQFSHSVVSNSWRPHGLQPARLLCPWCLLVEYRGPNQSMLFSFLPFRLTFKTEAKIIMISWFAAPE